MKFETIIWEKRDDVAVITLNRPRVLNAQNEQLIQEFHSALRAAATDTEVRVVIVKGEGKAFCSGYDISSGHLGDALTAERMQETTRLMLRIGKPTIAAIQGYCLGGGCEWAMNFDLRIAASDAKFGFPEAKIGATITNAGTKLLPLLVGLGRASELILTSRIIDANTAEQWGLVNKVVSLEKLDAEAMEIAQKIKSNNTLAVYLNRLGLWHGISSTTEQVLDFELMQAIITSQAPTTLPHKRKKDKRGD